MKRSPILLVHGGAWAIPDDRADAHRRGVLDALEAGYARLEHGASALDAVEAAVSSLEDDPTFDAGRGSVLTSDGQVQMDALLMDGVTLQAGGVACVEHLRNPIRAARLVLERSPHVYLVGAGAEQFAQSEGMTLVENAELVIERERRRLAEARAASRMRLADRTSVEDDRPSKTSTSPYSSGDGVSDDVRSHDTVGAVALDGDGRLAAGTSTGGTLNKAPGRVGDSSLIGCGCYADNTTAAASLTGWGEPIMKLVLGKWATDRVGEGRPPDEVAPKAIAYLERRLNGYGGVILLAPDGRYGLAHNTPRMAWGIHTVDGPRVGLRMEHVSQK